MLKSKSGYGSKSFMVSGDGQVSYLTPAEMGRRELHENIPMHAVMGLQKKERSMSMAFASFAADLDVLEQEKTKQLSFTEKISHKSQASLMLMDEMEMDAAVVSAPLIFAVLVAALTQLLVGKLTLYHIAFHYFFISALFPDIYCDVQLNLASLCVNVLMFVRVYIFVFFSIIGE